MHVRAASSLSLSLSLSLSQFASIYPHSDGKGCPLIDSPVQVEPNLIEPELSSLERMGFKALGYVPGLKGMTASRRLLTAMRGGAWTVAGYGASQLLRLASTVTLARMLAPQAFGLVALVNVFLSGLEMLSDLGIGMDVVQHPRGEDPVFINTAFIIQAGRGFILWGIATALAYPFAAFYHQPAVVLLAIVGATSVGIRSLASGSVWGLTRKVELGKLTALNTGSDFLGFIVALIWAIVSPTAWALVVGRVAATVGFTVASHLIAKHPVSLKWDSKAARDIFGRSGAAGNREIRQSSRVRMFLSGTVHIVRRG
jgi:hypothetical protein